MTAQEDFLAAGTIIANILPQLNTLPNRRETFCKCLNISAQERKTEKMSTKQWPVLVPNQWTQKSGPSAKDHAGGVVRNLQIIQKKNLVLKGSKITRTWSQFTPVTRRKSIMSYTREIRLFVGRNPSEFCILLATNHKVFSEEKDSRNWISFGG